MDYLKLVKVATRMLLDVIAVMEKKENDYEIGCKCKDKPTAHALAKLLMCTLQDLPVEVRGKEDNVVVIKPLTLLSYPDPSSEEHHHAQSSLPPSPPSLSEQVSPSLP